MTTPETSAPTRYATVSADAERVTAYLPRGYTAYQLRETEHYDGVTLIAGADTAGWTLDAYVIPRLASGGMFATEVTDPIDIVAMLYVSAYSAYHGGGYLCPDDRDALRFIADHVPSIRFADIDLAADMLAEFASYGADEVEIARWLIARFGPVHHACDDCATPLIAGDYWNGDDPHRDAPLIPQIGLTDEWGIHYCSRCTG